MSLCRWCQKTEQRSCFYERVPGPWSLPDCKVKHPPARGYEREEEPDES